jgi:putative hydroxymethylpyrimidine transport system permease protein
VSTSGSGEGRRPRRGRQIAELLLGVVALLLLWEGAVRWLRVKPYLLPAPTAIWAAGWESRRFLLQHLLATLQTTVTGFGVALGLAGLLALTMHWAPPVARLLQPLTVVSQTLPTAITAPLLLIWVGFSFTTKVVAAVLNAFFPILVALYDGLRRPDPDAALLFAAAGATRWQRFWKLELPGAVPALLSGMRVGMVSALTGAVVGEWIVGKDGLGFWAKSMAAQLETAETFAAVALTSLLGVTLYLLLGRVERLLLAWQRPVVPR